MGKALYRKYRSKQLSEIVGQEHITTTLQQALKTGKISHAYLFTGPRGTGKTSIARILAHEINGLPYTDDATHLDIIEIDAASNRRIDEIRDLRERVHNAPTNAQYKVYIIDEVHMLTKEAFNALLKTLEEPPAHAIFILATTESHKVPDTIISRTQRFTFRPIDHSAAVAHLRTIATSEKLDVTDEALALIATAGNGSFRDSISLLDQTATHERTTDVADVQRILGIAPEATITALWTAMQSGSPGTIIASLENLRNGGFQAGQVAKQLAQTVRQAMITTNIVDATNLSLLAALLEVPTATNPTAKLELVVLGYGLQPAASTPYKAAARATPPPLAVTQPTTTKPPTPDGPGSKIIADSALAHDIQALQQAHTNATVGDKPAAQQASKTITAEPVEDTVTTPPSDALQPFDNDSWQQVLAAVKKTHNTLYSVLRMATPQIDADTLVLSFPFAFHQKRINDTKNKQQITAIIREVSGRNIDLVCTVAAPSADPVVTPPPATNITPDPSLAAISNIFGDAEVLDS